MSSAANTPLYIKLNDKDNVAIIANDGGLPAGTSFPDGLTLIEHVPQSHKTALRRIEKGEAVIRYGVPIGYASQTLKRGSWVAEDRMTMPEAPELSSLVWEKHEHAHLEPLTGYTFEGYRNEDGSVGTRNLLAISTTVHCASPVMDYAVKRIEKELLPKYPNVDGVVPLHHVYGCGVAIDAPDAYIPIRTLHNLTHNPNFGGEAIIVSLGCEKLTTDRLMPPNSHPAQKKGPYIVNLQDESLVGFEAMVEAIMRMAEERLVRLNARRRQTCPASDLCLALECGGSDAFSGAAANPAVGYAADMLVRAGGTVFFSEVTEVRDGIAQLVARAETREVADGLIREMAWYDAYLAKGGVDRSANTTPGNKKGGLNNIVEKAMGSIVKSGSSPISGVYGPGERIPHNKKGLYYLATPASDIVCSPLQVAAGANLLVFITGRGTPYGLAELPVIKVGTRNDLARRWHDLIDVNAGRIATGEATIESVGKEIFQLILEVASGRKTWAEHWGLKNFMAIFNPAPIT